MIMPRWYVQKDKLQLWVACRLPRWLISWASVRMIAHATQGIYSNTVVPELTAIDALKRWDEKVDSNKD